MAQVVQLPGRDAGLHVRGDEVEHFGGEAPGDAHPLELLGGLRNYSHWTDYARILHSLASQQAIIPRDR